MSYGCLAWGVLANGGYYLIEDQGGEINPISTESLGLAGSGHSGGGFGLDRAHLAAVFRAKSVTLEAAGGLTSGLAQGNILAVRAASNSRATDIFLEPPAMIEFPNVSQEFRSLVSRRKELFTFLGSVFAGLGIFLQNTLEGSLPPALASIEEHLFAFYAVMLLAPCLIVSLRLARLHGGMVINGMLYARLMQNQTFTRPGSVERAAAPNVFGVSFLQFLLADFIAGFSAAMLGLTLELGLGLSLAMGLGVAVLWLLIYFHFHHRAVVFARAMIAREECEPFTQNDWEAHVAGTLEDANHDLLSTIGFVGLIVFSVFEVMSGLGRIQTNRLTDLRAEQVTAHGPQAYTLLMLVTCLMGLIKYLRVRVAIGRFSLDLDPDDRPFRPFVFTDSLMGYILVAFFMSVAVHLSLIQAAPGLPQSAVLIIDALALVLAILAEPLTLIFAARKYQGEGGPPPAIVPAPEPPAPEAANPPEANDPGLEGEGRAPVP